MGLTIPPAGIEMREISNRYIELFTRRGQSEYNASDLMAMNETIVTSGSVSRILGNSIQLATGTTSGGSAMISEAIRGLWTLQGLFDAELDWDLPVEIMLWIGDDRSGGAVTKFARFSLASGSPGTTFLSSGTGVALEFNRNSGTVNFRTLDSSLAETNTFTKPSTFPGLYRIKHNPGVSTQLFGPSTVDGPEQLLATNSVRVPSGKTSQSLNFHVINTSASNMKMDIQKVIISQGYEL